MNKRVLYQIGIAIVALLLFLPSTSVHLFDWDEINFAEAAREMLVTKDYFTVTINYLPFWEKPPLFIWMQALSMKAFGVNEFAARFPNIIGGIITLIALFNIGKRIYNIEFGRLWVLAYLGALLPQLYFMSGIIDPFYNLFIFLSLYYVWEFNNTGKAKHLFFSAVLAGLAVLTKGPVAVLLLFIILFVYGMAAHGKKSLRSAFTSSKAWMAAMILLAVCAVYYGTEFIRHGSAFFTGFIDYHLRLLTTGEARHGQPFYYHFFVLLAGCLPVSLLMAGGFNPHKDNEEQRDFSKIMMVMFFVVILVFSIVKTKIIHYSSLCYFPLTYLAAKYMYNVAYRRMKPREWITTAMVLLSGFFSLLLIVLPSVMQRADLLTPFIRDPFAMANLGADVSWRWTDGLGGYMYFFSLAAFVYLSSSRRYALAFSTLLVGTALGINSSVKLLVPKVEQITQAAAIEFYESIEDSSFYLETLDFKSYGHLFYGRAPRPDSDREMSRDDLLYGVLDRPAYFVVKNTNADKYRDIISLEELYEKNGFVFFRRN